MTVGQQAHEQQQLYLYRCSCCGTILKETETAIDSSILRSLKNERCISCGSDLQEQTIAIESASTIKRQTAPSISRASLLLPTLERAFDLQKPKLTFDIPQIDCLLDLADRGVICVTSSDRDGAWHANTLVTRACVRALMSKRQGGLDSPSVIFIDAGNCSDVYECVDFIRQYGLDSDNILDRIVVSRPFTIHQLARLMVDGLQSAIRRFGARLVIISDMLHMFTQDPRLDPDEARWLLKEIAWTLRKLSAQTLILVSVTRNLPQYAGDFLSLVGSGIDIDADTNTTASSSHMEMRVSNHRFRTNRTIMLPERDLQLIPPR